MQRTILLPLGLLIAVQMFDIAVHIATGQVEPLRIASNIVIVAGAFAAMRLAPGAARSAVWIGGLGYLALNLVFLAVFGLTNPATETVRVPLFVFVAVSLALLWWFNGRRNAAR